MSAVAEVLHPFIEETGRATAGSHSLLGDNVGHILFDLIYVRNNQCVPASLSI